jgi:polyhydroxyalkanoate synthesis regulator phasin
MLVTQKQKQKKVKSPHIIPVFKSERESGLAEQIQASASIAYLTQLQDTNLSQEVVEKFYQSVGSEADDSQFDLFYLNTILVTTGWNKNDDVFQRDETWAARYTPIHKQFNLEHNQSKIIGHMTSARAVDESFNLIADDSPMEELPAKFHILTGAVIYRALSDEKAQEEIEQIIAEIQEGEWFVSMECLFRGFDYAMTSKEGEQRVIARNEETAFLTKYLKRYGGDGLYNDFSVGRALKNITFSGKGLVRKPANPESIIFNSKDIVKAFFVPHVSSLNDLGYNTSNDSTQKKKEKEVKVMANENVYTQADVDKLNGDIKTLNDKVVELTDNLTKANTARSADVEAKNGIITDLKSQIEVLTNNSKAILERAEKAEAELNSIKAAEVVRARVEKLVKLNAPEAEAKEIVTLFADKNDEQFDAIAKLFSGKWEGKKLPANASVAAPVVDQTALDDVVPQPDPKLGVHSTVDEEVENTRKSMSAVFAGFLMNPNLECAPLE